MQVIIFGIKQLTLMHQLRQSQRGAGFSTTNHSSVEDKGRSSDVTSFVEGFLDCLDELDLRVIGFDVEGGEELIVVGVVDQLRVLDDDCLVCVVIVFF